MLDAERWERKWKEEEIKPPSKQGEEERCDFCGEMPEYKFGFKIVGRPVDWYACSVCLETLRRQLSKPTPKEKVEAFVPPAHCQFCGKSIDFNPDRQRFEEKGTLNMLYYYVDICEDCRKEMLVAVEKTEKIIVTLK